MSSVFPKKYRDGSGISYNLSRVKLVDHRAKNDIFIGFVNGEQRAIKVNHTSDEDSTIGSPFCIEINILIDLEKLFHERNIHLPIPKLHEWGYVNDKYLSFTMTPVGQPLYIQYSVEETIDIILQLVFILRQLHALGYIHAGIRRDNIMTYNDRVYLLDFERTAKIGHPKSGVRPMFRSPYCKLHKAATSDDWIPLLYLALDLLEGDLPWSNVMQLKYELTENPKKLFEKPEYHVFRKMHAYMLKNVRNIDPDQLIYMLESEQKALQSKL